MKHPPALVTVLLFASLTALQAAEFKPAVFDWLPVDESKVVAAPPTAADSDAKTLTRLTLALAPKVLYPVREKQAAAKLTLTGFYADGSQRDVRPSEAVIQVRTKIASGNVEVAVLDGDQVVPKEGGIATVEATVRQRGQRLTASVDVVVAPFYRDYHQTLVLLQTGHTIHIDVFVAQGAGGAPLSPWHAKPENGGLTPDKYVETQRRIFRYWRDRGFDVTGEGTGWAHPPGEHFVGLQPMSWWYSWNPLQIPECLGARGRTERKKSKGSGLFSRTTRQPTALRGPGAGRDARAVQGASLRSLPRLGRPVRAERKVC